MGLIYNLLHWVDHVVETPNKRKFVDNGDGTYEEQRVTGEIIRQGTARNATNYNNIETGIFANSVFATFLMQRSLQQERSLQEQKGEIGEVIVSNSSHYPFPSGIVTIALKQKRSATNYYVRYVVMSAEGGLVDEIEILDKQLNGFKMRFKGSARAVNIRYYVIGGLYQQ